MENSKETYRFLAEIIQMQTSDIESNPASIKEMINLLKVQLEKMNASFKQDDESKVNLDKFKENAMPDLKELKDRVQALEDRLSNST